VFTRVSSNVLRPTFITNIGFELCEALKNNVTLMMKTRFVSSIFPQIYDMFKEFIHPCPYLPGRYVVQQVIDQLILPDFVKPYDYKVLVRAADRRNNTIGQGFGMVKVKQGFPVDRKVKTGKN
jgi:Protein of unknown function (DUF1091)